MAASNKQTEKHDETTDESKEVSTATDGARIVGTFEAYADFYRDSNAAPYEDVAQLIRQHCEKTKMPREAAHILDIGCGAAFTIDLLADKFEHISLVEPNPCFRSRWFAKPWMTSNDGSKHIVHIYPLTVEEMIKKNCIQPNSVDVAVLYHSVYHFEIATLKQTLNTIVGSLKAKGICVISVFDDDHKFAKRYLKLSPQYRLSASVAEALSEMDGVEVKKEHEVDEYCMNSADYLKFLEWLFIQDCMNHNYFPNGITEKQLSEVRQECKQYLETECVKKEQVDASGNKQVVYTDPESHSSLHFVVTKK